MNEQKFPPGWDESRVQKLIVNSMLGATTNGSRPMKPPQPMGRSKRSCLFHRN